MRLYLSLLGLALIFCGRIAAQTYETNNIAVQTFVGSGFYGHYDGQGTQTMFNYPSSIVVDSAGNFFVADNSNYRVRKITPGGAVTTVAGGGSASLPGYGTNVSLQGHYFSGMAIDHSNVLWIATSASLLRIAIDGLIQVVPLPGISSVAGVCVDLQNNLYVTDIYGNKIHRFRTNGLWEVFVGSGNQGAIDGNGIFNSFYGPAALAVDAADNIYVWDSFNFTIRKINQARDVVTIAGKVGTSVNADGTDTNASFAGVAGMVFDPSGNLILSSTASSYGLSGSSVRRMTPDGTVTTIAGSFNETGYVNGSSMSARFSGASGLCFSEGLIFLADSSNHRIRSISFNSAPQLVTGANLLLETYPGLKITGTVGRTYRVESSTDMSNWNPEQTILLMHSPYLWIDENALGAKKFYRGFLLP